MNVIGIASAAAIAALAVSACDRSNPDAKKAAAQVERQVERGVAALDDATVTAKVKTALIADDSLKALTINVDTSQNVVTLRGTVASEDLRRRAEQLARGIEGVKEVRNELTIKQPS